MPHSPLAPLRACLLSNGRYTVMTRDTGSGFSHWRNIAVTRWRDDPTADMLGSYVLVRDHGAHDCWSVTAQPLGESLGDHAMRLADGCVQFDAQRGAIASSLAIAVAQDVDGEVRRLTLHNQRDSACDLDVTSYAELVLGSMAADAAHPAFSKLFVQTEWEAPGVLLARRRPRGPEEPSIWVAHCAVGSCLQADSAEYETDRNRFLGRGRGLRDARTLTEPLSNTVGTVLDPVLSIRTRLRIPGGECASIAFWTLAAESREAVLASCAAHATAAATDRAFADADRFTAATCARIGIGVADYERCQHLVAPLVVADPAWRSSPRALAGGSGGAPVLWTRGISGDRPIVLVRVADEGGVHTVAQILRFQRLWQAMRVGVDVVVANVAKAADATALQATLDNLVGGQQALLLHDDGTRAEAFVFADDDIADPLRDALAAVARITCDAAPGGVDRLPQRREASGADATPSAPRAPLSVVAAPVETRPSTSRTRSRRDASLAFDNGIGGFATRAREYAIRLRDDACTPAPWINVLANASFGCLASAEGGGYTWSINSQQNPLTPWPKDPVSDAPHDVVYIRDDDSGDVWTVTALPVRVAGVTYDIRHGKGYSVFAHDAYDVAVEMTLVVPVADSVRLARIRLANRSDRPRRLTLTTYAEWALTPNGTGAPPNVVTWVDESTGALCARNAWRAEFGERVAFVDLGGAQRSASGDRATFLGTLGTMARPAALRDSAPLDSRVGAGLDPCAALRTHVALAPDCECHIVLALGDAPSLDAARTLVGRCRSADFDALVRDVQASWNTLLDVVQVRTPDPAFDVMQNDWLLYQTLACRMWARTAYYQASGAYGFRDQLQDAMALCIARPDVAREHLLRAAARQFGEGDVQHWWLPPAGQGLRTRMTDDRIWLAYAAAHYLDVSGDRALLEEGVPFAAGAPLQDGQIDAFFQPETGGAATFYEHCARAIDVSLTRGAHGLPLMGTGDWNDGMNRVGIGGRGESVWLAWFLIATIDAFLPFATEHADDARVRAWRDHAATLRVALEDAGWDGADGEWYRRGFYDDGSPLGSRDSAECRIDAIAQSWSVIAGIADRDRARRAMAAVGEHLIVERDRLALLFTPPFDRTDHDPGYIKGYPPGIRENGGQYTHGAIWSIFAYAMLGQGDRAYDLYSLLNPVTHAATAADIDRYRVEPYVACADVYSVAPHAGRGGWTWYTGSAGWLYRAGLEAILGFRLHGATLTIDPCLPAAWPGYELVYLRPGSRGVTTCYEIVVDRNGAGHPGETRVTLDDEPVEGGAPIALSDDGNTHRVRVSVG
jgi:cyclic beta-1,2-glucan synthetase